MNERTNERTKCHLQFTLLLQNHDMQCEGKYKLPSHQKHCACWWHVLHSITDELFLKSMEDFDWSVHFIRLLCVKIECTNPSALRATLQLQV